MSDVSTDGLRARIVSALSVERVREPSAHEARAARLIAEPVNAGEISELVRLCERDHLSIAALGGARMLCQIRRVPVAIGVSLARLTRVIAHEPDDLTVVAEAGLTVDALNTMLAEQRQRLPVDPQNPAMTSLGALVAAHRAGPLRLSEGTSRDLLIGIQYVGAGGRVVRAGGRVVKNVAGYDLMKVMTGSFGTLGVVTEVAFKVRPVPERYAIALARFDRADAAFGTAQRLHDALPLANLEIVSAGLGLSRPAAVLLAAGLAGTRAEIEFLRDRIVKLAEHKIEFLDGDEATRKHEELRDAELSDATLAALLATLPAELPQCLRDCGEIEYVAHAGSGVAEIFVRGELSLDEAKETVARWRSVARSVKGHVRLIRACDDVRDALDFFDTPNSAALALMRRLKQAFDPENIFNPDCFVAGL